MKAMVSRCVVGAVLLMLVVVGNSVASGGTADAQGPVKVYSLLVNGIPPGGSLRDVTANDVYALRLALDKEARDHVVNTMGTFGSPAGPAEPAALSAAIAASFGPSDANDICIFYYAAHGLQVADVNLDEADGKDGATQVGFRFQRDDDMDTPFNALIDAGNCGGGMVLMFTTCHSGELIEGGNDFNLPAPHVVMTSCRSEQISRVCTFPNYPNPFPYPLPLLRLDSCYGGVLAKGLTSQGAGMRADNSLDGKVTASELHAYVFGIHDAYPAAVGQAVPLTTDPASALEVLNTGAPLLLGSEPGPTEESFCEEFAQEVGGLTGLLDEVETPAEAAGGSGGAPLAPIAAAVAAGVAALAVGGWYARRRWVR